MNKQQGALSKIILITQFGISLITPVLVCLFVSLWIQQKWNTGYWVVVVGILLGLGGMGATFYRYYRKHTKNSDSEKEQNTQYNRHE